MKRFLFASLAWAAFGLTFLLGYGLAGKNYGLVWAAAPVLVAVFAFLAWKKPEPVEVPAEPEAPETPEKAYDFAGIFEVKKMCPRCECVFPGPRITDECDREECAAHDNRHIHVRCKACRVSWLERWPEDYGK